MFPLVIPTRRKYLPSRTQPKICPVHGQIEGQIMRKNKMIAKGCPKCDQQVPVACKACPCGYSFFNARRTTRAPSPAEDIRRRTQRVRREKPNYYDALEFDKQVKKAKTRSSECDTEEDGNRRDSTSSSKIKKRKLKKEDEEEDDVIVHFSPEKQAQCSIILAEINRKMDSVMWKQP